MNKELQHEENIKKGLKPEGDESIREQSESATDTYVQLEQCKVSLAEWQEKYARLSADLENFRRRTAKERIEWSQMAQAKLLTALLGIVDNYDRAMALALNVPAELKSWHDGISMIHASFHDYLKNAGVKEMEYTIFDPERHEALIQVESNQKEPGHIVEVLEKGYVLNDVVLRPAKVSVAK